MSGGGKLSWASNRCSCFVYPQETQQRKHNKTKETKQKNHNKQKEKQNKAQSFLG